MENSNCEILGVGSNKIPFMTFVAGHCIVHDYESGKPLDDEDNDQWTGICTDSKIDNFWYLGQVNGERSFHKLQSSNLTDASLEAKEIIDSEYENEIESMGIVTKVIGTVLCDAGSDKFLLVTRLDDDLTPKMAIDWLLPRVYKQAGGAGKYYCDTVRAVNAQHSSNSCICTIENRYDV